MDRIKQKFFNQPLLKKSRLIKAFNRMDINLLKALKLIDDCSFFVTQKYLDYYVDIASGSCLYKNMYKGKNSNRKTFKNRMISGFVNDDRKFLLESSNIILSAFGKSKLDLDSIRFNRLILVNIVEEFLNKTNGYVESYLCSDNINKDRIEHIVDSKVELFAHLLLIKYHYDRFIKNRDKVFNAYYRYIYSLATHNYGSGDQTSENFQQGFLGMLRALYLYDQHSGCAFATYLRNWINQSIMQGVYESFTISVPTNTWNVFNKVEKIRAENKTNSIKYMAKKSGFSEKLISNVYDRVLTTQVASIDALIETNDTDFLLTEESVSDLSGMMYGLTEDEKFILGSMIGETDIIENKAPKDHIEIERRRQLAS